MARIGWFDSELNPQSWFDSELNEEAWFDSELIDAESVLKLYLRNTTANGVSIGGVACYDLLTTQASTPDTAVVNTTAAGTEIQFTKTAGGAIAAFITGRVPSGGWTITSSDVSLWMQESGAAVNAGLRFRLFKYSGGVETELGGSPFSTGTEFNTASTAEVLVGNVTDTLLAEDDRLLLRVYAVNVGTMAVGTATLNFNSDTDGRLAITRDQSVQATGVVTTGATITISQPPAGSLIITVCSADKDSGGFTTPSGFTVVGTDYTSANVSGAIAYKIATGSGETSINWTYVNVGSQLCQAWAGVYTMPTIDISVDVVAQANSGVGVVTSQTSGTTGATAIADSLAMAFFGSDSSTSTITGGALTNSFTILSNANVGSNAGLVVGEKILSATGTQESTYTTTAAGDQMWGAAVVFKAVSPPAPNSYINVYPAIAFKAEAGGVPTGAGSSESGVSGSASGVKIASGIGSSRGGTKASASGVKVGQSNSASKSGVSGSAAGSAVASTPAGIGANETGASGSAAGVKIATGVGASRTGSSGAASAIKIAASASIAKSGSTASAIGTKTAASRGSSATGNQSAVSGQKVAASAGASKSGASGSAVGISLSVPFSVGASKTGADASASGIKIATGIGASRTGSKANAPAIKIAALRGASAAGNQSSATGKKLALSTGASKVGNSGAAAGVTLSTPFGVGGASAGVSGSATGFKVAVGIGASRIGACSRASEKLDASQNNNAFDVYKAPADLIYNKLIPYGDGADVFIKIGMRRKINRF